MLIHEQLETVFAELRLMWRHRWPAIICAWSLCVVGWFVVFAIPPKYETIARVYVDSNSLLRPLLQGLAVPPNTVNQIELVKQALLARPQLERVIESTDLKARVKDQLGREKLVAKLADEISIVGSGGRDGAATFYKISFTDVSADTSYAVVSELLESFVRQSLGANESSTESAQKFLTDQLKEYERRLSDSEEKLADFKRRNVGVMPDDRGGYFERLQSDMTELDRLQSALVVASNRREELRSKLLGGGLEGSRPETPSTATLETSVDGRLAESKRQLESLLLRFTDAHPDVQATRETIERLEAIRQTEIETLRSNRGALGAPRGATSLVAQNLQIALNQVELEISSLRSQIADRQSRVTELRGKITTVPAVEAELSRLNRDYTVTKTQYDALLQRLESARLSGQADRTDELRIRVIEPPVRPLAPSSPRLAALLSAVLLMASAVGGALAYLLSKISPVFLSAKQVTALAGLPVLGTINLVESPLEVSSRRRSSVTAAIAACGLGLCLMLLLALAPTMQGWVAQTISMVKQS